MINSVLSDQIWSVQSPIAEFSISCVFTLKWVDFLKLIYTNHCTKMSWFSKTNFWINHNTKMSWFSKMIQTIFSPNVDTIFLFANKLQTGRVNNGPFWTIRTLTIGFIFHFTFFEWIIFSIMFSFCNFLASRVFGFMFF